MSDLAGPDWVVVYEGSGVQADVVRASLEAAGFTVFGLGEQSPYPGLGFDTGRVYVAAPEADRAREFLESALED